MKYIFWNVRGDAASVRQKCIEDTIRPLNPAYIGFQETKKENFSNSFLKNLLGNMNFELKWLLATGTAGGILVGVDIDVFNIVS